jgi:hypothetical protein
MKLESLLSEKNRKALKKKNVRHLLMTVTGFEALSLAGQSGVNRESALLQLTTWHREFTLHRAEMSKGTFRLYVSYASTAPQGFGHHAFKPGAYAGNRCDSSCYLSVRKGNKTVNVSLLNNWLTSESDDTYLLRELSALGVDVGDMGKHSTRHDIESIAHGWKGETELGKRLADAGCKVVDAFIYHDRITITPEFVHASGFKVEFGYQSKHTYHSLPRTLTIDFAPNLKLEKLADLGIETPGYYSHDSRHAVLAADADAAKQFAKRYQARRDKPAGSQ